MSACVKILSLILALNSFAYASSYETTQEEQRRAFESARQAHEDAELAQALQASLSPETRSANSNTNDDADLDAALAASLMTPSAQSSSNSQGAPTFQTNLNLDQKIIQREYLRQEQEAAFKRAQEIDRANAAKFQRTQALEKAEAELKELNDQLNTAEQKRKNHQAIVDDVRSKIQNTRDRLKRYGANPNLEKQLKTFERELAEAITAREEVNDLEITPLLIRIDSAREKVSTLIN